MFVNSETKENTMLMSLYVDGNQLTEIPRDIQYATGLNELGFNRNFISNVPKKLGL